MPPEMERRCREERRRARKLEQWHRTRKLGATAKEAAEIVGVPVRTLYHWDRCAREGCLRPRSKRPHRTRRSAVPRRLAEEILRIRRDLLTCTWGPLKIAVELARLHGGVPLPSPATIGRILRGLKDRGLIPERAPGRKRPRKRRAAGDRYAVRRPKGFRAKKPGEMMQMDTCHLRLPGGGKAYQFDFYDPAGR